MQYYFTLSTTVGDQLEEREQLDLRLSEEHQFLQEKVALVTRLRAGRYPKAKELEMKERKSLSVTAVPPEKKQKAGTNVEQVDENANTNAWAV